MTTMKCVVSRLREIADEIEVGAELINASEEREMLRSTGPDIYIVEHRLSGVRTISVIWKPQERDGCKNCEYLCMIDRTRLQGGCNHPRNIQPRVRNFQRQKPLCTRFFPSPPAWCKLKEK